MSDTDTDHEMLPSPNDEALYRRLASTICNILLKYNGTREETLAGWFFALKLSEVGLWHLRQLVEVFNRLLAEGLIQLHSSEQGPYNGGDDSFLLRSRFTTT